MQMRSDCQMLPMLEVVEDLHCAINPIPGELTPAINTCEPVLSNVMICWSFDKVWIVRNILYSFWRRIVNLRWKLQVSRVKYLSSLHSHQNTVYKVYVQFSVSFFKHMHHTWQTYWLHDGFKNIIRCFQSSATDMLIAGKDFSNKSDRLTMGSAQAIRVGVIGNVQDSRQITETIMSFWVVGMIHLD